MEVEKLTQLIDKIEVLTFIVKYLLSTKGPGGDKPTLLGRPESAFEKLLEEKINDVSREDNNELRDMLGF